MSMPVSTRWRIRQGARGGQCGKVAAESDDDRQERAAVQSQRAHRTVHNERGAGQIARVLEHRQQQEHDAHHRNERQHGDHAVQHAVHQQRIQPAVGRGRTEQSEQPVDTIGAPSAHRHVEPVLHRACQRGGRLEDRVHDRQKDQNAEHGMEQHPVDAVGQRRLVGCLEVEPTKHTRSPVEARVGTRLGPLAHVDGVIGRNPQSLRQRSAGERCRDRGGESVLSFAGASIQGDHRHAVKQLRQPRRFDATVAACGQIVHGEGHHRGQPKFRHHR